jgi:hypothetical protein
MCILEKQNNRFVKEKWSDLLDTIIYGLNEGGGWTQIADRLANE